MRYLFLFLLIFGLSCDSRTSKIPSGKCPPGKCPGGNCQVLMIVTGTVVSIGDVWTMNGDGGLTVVTNSGRKIEVGIRGWPAMYTRTEMKLKTVKYVKDLVGKKVQVRGKFEKNGYISADILTEL